MTLSGIFFLVLGILIAGYLWQRRLFEPRSLPFLLFVYHLGFAFVYWQRTLIRTADSNMYYGMASGFERHFGVGTSFIVWLAQRVIWLFSPSYLDLFLFFQLAGFLGFCILYRTIMGNFLVSPISRRIKYVMIMLLFLPNMHYWSVAIGKDSLIFLGITMSLWALAEPKKRWGAVLAALLLIACIRPHIAAFFLAAIGATLLWARGVPMRWRIGISSILILAAIMAAPFLMNYVHLESVDMNTLEDYADTRQTRNLKGGGAMDMREDYFYTKFFTYLYRPLFFDSPNILGMVASLENVIWILFSLVLFSKYFLNVLKKHPNNFFIRFNIIYFVMTTTILSSFCSNLGISVRQKNMVMPSLLILILTTYAMKRDFISNKDFQEAGSTQSLVQTEVLQKQHVGIPITNNSMRPIPI